MNELLFAAIGFTAGAALTAAATLRHVRRLRDERDAAALNLRREQRRYDLTQRLARQSETQAAAQIVALSYALHDATTKVAQAHEATAVIGADPQALLRRFSRN
jgi:hypothetical protein